MSVQDRRVNELRERLALGNAATTAEILETYRELERFLSSDRVPRRLRAWAEHELALARQASEADPATPTRAPSTSRDELPELFEDDEAILTPGRSSIERERGAEGGVRANHGANRSTAQPEPAGELAPVRNASREELPDFFEDDEPAMPTAPRRKTARPPESERRPSRRGKRASGPLARWRGLALVFAIALAVLGLALGNPALFPGQTPLGAPGGEDASPRQARTLDEARVAELMAVVARNPRDADALFELGEIHFQADRWQDAIDWFTTLLEVDPSNVHARTDVGTANFNLGKTELAKQAWEEVAALDPKDPQIHYNLGFLYANSDSRDLERALKEWELVVQLAPGSDLAKTAQAHLDALKQR